MEIGVVLPQLPPDTAPERYATFARTVERQGYHHLLAYDHVLGTAPDRPGWEGVYTHEMPLHEPLTLLASLAGATDRIRLVTGILILPQRQTALVAKQAAEVDVLSGGRLRLGVGIGWNEPEYVALGEDFTARGRRVAEQVEVLRQLWTEELVTYEGDFHDLPAVGINPRPVQRPIPIWMGGGADAVLRRIARQADGWVMPGGEPSELEPRIRTLADHLAAVDRSLADVTLLARTGLSGDEPATWVEEARAWQAVGATHLAVDARGADRPTERLATFAEALTDADLAFGG